MINTDLLKAKYQTQSDLNNDALTAFNTKYPLVAVGARFVDYNGLTWEIVAVLTNGNVVNPIAAWINDDDVVTLYQQSVYGIMLQKAEYVHTLEFDTVDTVQVYDVATYPAMAELVGATALAGQLGAAVLDVSGDFSIDIDTGTLTFVVPVSGQHCEIVYKKPNDNLPPMFI